jgi:hypothetical protein
MRLANEVPRSVAMLAPLDNAMGEGQGGTAAESEESNSRDLSENIENGAQNGGRQKRIVKIYGVLEEAARTRILVADAGTLLQSGRADFRSGCTRGHRTPGRLC